MADIVGFIGLGVMGAPMARNVGSKYDVLAFDIDKTRMQAVANLRVARDIAGVGVSARTVLLSLPGSGVVREVILGSNGLMQNMARGSVIIDTSTTEPGVTQEISGILASNGISYLDAPVSGGEKAAIDGTLSIMVGGDEAVFNQHLAQATAPLPLVPERRFQLVFIKNAGLKQYLPQLFLLGHRILLAFRSCGGTLRG